MNKVKKIIFTLFVICLPFTSMFAMEKNPSDSSSLFSCDPFECGYWQNLKQRQKDYQTWRQSNLFEKLTCEEIIKILEDRTDYLESRIDEIMHNLKNRSSLLGRVLNEKQG